MKLTYILTGLVLGSVAIPVLADPPSQTDPHAPPVCSTMPDRNGHFWDDDDWCRWMREFDNNRDWRNVPKGNNGR